MTVQEYVEEKKEDIMLHTTLVYIYIICVYMYVSIPLHVMRNVSDGLFYTATRTLYILGVLKFQKFSKISEI